MTVENNNDIVYHKALYHYDTANFIAFLYKTKIKLLQHEKHSKITKIVI